MCFFLFLLKKEKETGTQTKLIVSLLCNVCCSVALEKSLDVAKDKAPPSNVIFDDSGNFVLYPTMAGIKVVNLVTNQLVRLIGKVSGRYLHYFYF